MQSASCPDREQLSDYLLGKLPEDEAEFVFQHLEECSTCDAAVSELETEVDPLILQLRSPAPASEFEQEPECQQVLAEVEAFGRTSAISSGPSSQPEQADLGRLREYQLLSELGQGGMGTVYKALHTELEKIVALKVLPTERMQDEQAVSRFRREMKAVGRVDHPNIVRATDAGQFQGTHFLVMEYVEGVDLSKILRQIGTMTVPDACEIIRQAATGLEHAHQQGLIHRDVKPSNLMLSRHAFTGQEPARAIVKILDLGLARLYGDHVKQEELTGSHQIVGTIDYMSPEQFDDAHSVDIRADIYGLGCTLYKLLSGEVPFSDSAFSNIFRKMKAHAEAPVPVLADVRPDVPSELAEIVSRMLAKDPADRFQTAADIAEALEPFTDGSNLPGLLEQAHDRESSDTGRKQPRPSTVDGLSSALTDTYVPDQDQQEPSPIHAGRHRKDRASTRPPRGRKRTAAILAVCAAFLVALGTVIYVSTGEGQLEITVNKPGVKVMIDGQEPDPPNVTITDKDGEEITIRIVKVAAGKHTMEVTKKDFATRTESFWLFRNGKKRLSAILKPTRKPTDGVPSIATDAKLKPEQNRNYALKFDGKSSHVRVETLKYDGSHPVTVEATVRPGRQVAPNGISQVVLLGCLFHVECDVDFWQVRGRGEEEVGLVGSKSDLPISIGRVVHIAGVYDGTSLRLYVDGKLQHSPTKRWLHTRGPRFDVRDGDVKLRQFHVPVHARGSNTYIGSHSQSLSVERRGCFVGLIDEVRISNIARYREGFTPEERFVSDEHTMALYHFDEGQGNVLCDFSGNGHHGKIRGAKWVKTDGTPIGAQRTEPHRWPQGAPAPAIAPFDADQAKKHQQAWADYFGVPVEKEIDLGNDVKLTMLLIPPGEFLMGSTEEERARFLKEAKVAGDTSAVQDIPFEGPQHRVRITRPFYLGKHEVTQAQWESLMGNNPSKFKDDPANPVELVSWNDIQPLLRKLNEQHNQAGMEFVLPTEAQWEYACRAGTTTYWHCGGSEAALREYAWFRGNRGGKEFHAVGQLQPNGFGLHDMHGNVWEWCADLFSADYYAKSPVDDPRGPSTASHRAHRGGHASDDPSVFRSACRRGGRPDIRNHRLGFRLACEISYKFADKKVELGATSTTPPAEWQLPPGAPPPAVAPFDAEQAKKHQEAWADYLGVLVEKEIDLDNDVKLTIVLIPPGEFLMGSTAEEQARFLEEAKAAKDQWVIDRIPAQGPQHRVRITRPFYLGKYEVTQAQWEALMGSNPSQFKQDQANPVEMVSRADIQPLLKKLNQQHTRVGMEFILPTEAQWEHACRAGTTTYWHSGDSEAALKEYAWFNGNAGGKTHPVGQLRSNGFGLYDMHGNVWEWCADWFAADYYANSPADDPSGATTGSLGVRRGGSWSYHARNCRSVTRGVNSPRGRHDYLGFRLAAVLAGTGEKAGDKPGAGADDPHRRAAEWVLAHGGTVSVAAGSEPVPVESPLEEYSQSHPLPGGNFRLCSISLTSCTNIGDAELGQLVPLCRQIPTLTHLWLEGTRVTGKGLQHLLPLRDRLRVLHIRQNPSITDDGLQSLRELKLLETLYISRDHRFSESGLRALRASLPNCSFQLVDPASDADENDTETDDVEN